MSDSAKKLELEELDQLNEPLKGSSLWKDAWKRLRKNRMAMFGLVMISLYMFISLSAPILPIHSYKQQVLDHQFLPPSFTRTAGELMYEKQENLFKRIAEKENRELKASELEELADLQKRIETETRVLLTGEEVLVHQRKYFLGTDGLGRDLMSRIIYGGQVSIMIGLLGGLVSALIGTVLGALSGYIGGRFDYFFMRFVDIMYSLPFMLLVIIFMAIFGRSMSNLFFALALVSWLTVSRVVRGQIISLKNSEFVEAARSCGAGTWRIVMRHLVPNTLGIIIVYTTLRVPVFIMEEAFLSFLGLGVQAPFASWGSLVQDGVSAMTSYPWMLILPALAMTTFLFFMNFLGDGLRDAFDPQSKNSL